LKNLQSCGFKRPQKQQQSCKIVVPTRNKIFAFLRVSNITKVKGATAQAVFTTIFLLSFQKETWFQKP